MWCPLAGAGFGGGGDADDGEGEGKHDRDHGLSFNDFAEANSHLFEGEDEDEMPHEAYLAFRRFTDSFAAETEAFLEEEKRDGQEFYDIAQAARGHGDSTMVLELALSTLDFEVFTRLMRRYAAQKRRAEDEAADMGF